MEHSLNYYEKHDPLPPSYSSVMIEKEMWPLNTNAPNTSHEAKKMIKLVQLQSDFLEWRNKCYLEKIDEIAEINTTQDMLDNRLQHANKLLEKMIQEAEAALHTNVRPMKKKKKKRQNVSHRPQIQDRHIEHQRLMDMTLNDILDTITPDIKPKYTSTFSSLIHHALTHIIRSPKSASGPLHKLKTATKIRTMLFTIILIIHTLISRSQSHWAKHGHKILTVWKQRPKTQYRLLTDHVHSTLFVSRLICKYSFVNI
ncbi:hypothetical protein BY458DRAFT_508358 [Sporodiniella umbellata]|nr:hypothetical protein BY458DRAFT_508358 [Sporodiniella umbellata]